MNELGGGIIAVIDKYAKENGYVLVIDISSQQTPVVYRSDSTDITKDIIELYDRRALSPAVPPRTGPAVPAPKPVPPK
jgi:uncharacterized UPF0146 family protein